MKKIVGAVGACFMLGMVQAATWDGGAGDGEFGTASNWNDDLAPGTAKTTYVLTGGTQNVTNSMAVVRESGINYFNITMRNGATLDIQADLDIGLGTYGIGTTGNGSATVTHSAGAVVGSSYKLGLSTGSLLATTALSGTASMALTNLELNGNSLFSISGSDVSVAVSADLTMSDDGELAFDFGSAGINAISVGGIFTIDSDNSQLTIDATGMAAGVYDLVTFQSQVGIYDLDNITIFGLADDLSGSITYDADSMNLTVIPEPATIGMLGLGTVVTVLLRKKRK